MFGRLVRNASATVEAFVTKAKNVELTHQAPDTHYQRLLNVTVPALASLNVVIGLLLGIRKIIPEAIRE